MSGTTYSVTSEAQLNADIAAINAASATAAGTTYTINVAASLKLTSNLAAINIAAGTSLVISAATPTLINGQSIYRGFVDLSGDVTLSNLTLSNLLGTGGAGGGGAKPGGGGAGLGGAVFVATGASMTLNAVNFTGDIALGGAAGRRTISGIGAGGSGEPNGFGAGGAGGVAGSFGGGGGAGAPGGFGAGSNGGAGAAMGGDVFVQQGGQLTYAGGAAIAGRVVPGGVGANGYGSGIFIQGDTTITFGSVTVSGVIADQTGSGGSGANAGAGTIIVNGATTLSATNTYTGGTVVQGSLTLAAVGAAGTGAIGFSAGGALIVDAGDLPANTLIGFAPGNSIDLQGIGLATGYTIGTGNAVTFTGGAGGSTTLQFDPRQGLSSIAFILNADAGATGTAITAVQTKFVAGSEADLNTVLAEIDKGGVYSAAGVAYTITLTSGFTLNTDPNAVNLASGDTLTIDGGGYTINGGGLYRGLLVYGGTVTVQNLTLADTAAIGGAGGAGAAPGGGGAGLGGGLFIASGAAVTLNNVNFQSDVAIGGAAGGAGAGYGGGGGLGGAGGNGASGIANAGGGGGVGNTARGGNAVGGTGISGSGGTGILIGAGAGIGGTGQYGSYFGPGGGGAYGGGGGGSGTYSGSGRDPRSYPGSAGAGGDRANGSFGGGAGSGSLAGFGGGGAAYNGAANGSPNSASANGGWGGGGGGGTGGFGGGSGFGGGLGAGGDIFVQSGGSLTIGAGSLSGGSVAGGVGSLGGGNGSAFGSGIFFQGGGGTTLNPAAGQTLTLSDAITDQQGSGGAGAQHVTINGAGTVVLSATNTYSGGTVINGGTVSLQAPGAAGSGLIDFGYGSTAELVVGPGDVPANTIAFFLPGDVIDLLGIGTATSAVLSPKDMLNVTGGKTPVQLSLYRGQIFTGETFTTSPDGHGGALITPVTVNNDHPPFISGTVANGDDHTPFSPLAGVRVSDLDVGQTETATLHLSSTANGTLSHLGRGSYNAPTGTYTVSGSAAQVTAAIDALVFTPTIHQVAPGGTVQTTFDLSVTDGLMQADTPFTSTVTALNDVPTITGGSSQYYGYWGVPLTPFTGMTVVDPDVGASETVTISLGSYFAGDSGTLSLANPVDGVSLTTVTPGALYTLSAASPQAVTAALDALQYTPTTGNPSLGFTIGNIGLSVADGIAPPVAGPGVTVYAGLPIASGTVANQTVLDTATIQPFATVQITDSQPFTTVAVTVILLDPSLSPTDALGTLTGVGLTKVGVGTYSLDSGTQLPFQSASAAVDALVFHPPTVASGQSATTTFELSMFDGATTHNDYSTTVLTTAPTAAAAISAGLQTGQSMAFLAGFSAANWSGGDADPTTHPVFDAVADLVPSYGAAGSGSEASGAYGYGMPSDPMGALAWLLQTATHGEGGAAAI